MDCQATLSISVTQCDPTSATTPLHWPAPATVHVSCPAKQLAPQQRRDLAIQVLAGTETVSELAREHELSRKFLYQQVHTAQQALDSAFAPVLRSEEVLFYLPVTKSWLRQLVLALVFICHSSTRGVVELLRDVFDYRISLGTVHNIVHSPVAHARRINQQYDLSTIVIGLLDEIFQAPIPFWSDLWPQLFSDVNCIALWISSEKILTRLYSVLHWFHKRLEVNIKNSRENLCLQIIIVFSFGSFDNSNKCTVLWKITARLITVSTSVNNEMWVKLSVLVGVDAKSTFCFLLSPEEHRDADTWGVRLLELVDQGFAPKATIADFGSGLRAGHQEVLPEVPCRGDVFHALYHTGPLVRYLENRAYEAMDVCAKLERKQATTERRRGCKDQSLAKKLSYARPAEAKAIVLADEVALLARWLRDDILSVAGPEYAIRRDLFDFVVAELRAASRPVRIGSGR